jgi:hypothetical protein
MLAERALQAVIANVTPNALAITSGRLFLFSFGFCHIKTQQKFSTYRLN